jgi:4-hydroxy-tetrahydrodipicolinate reductase
MVTRVGIAGFSGRMGQEIVAAAAEDEQIDVVGGVVRPGSLNGTGHGLPGRLTVVDQVHQLLPAIDVLIDFTNPITTLEMARACAAAGRPIVSGVTGLSDDQLDELRAVGSQVPVFYARNMSVGLNALLGVLPALAQALDGYDIEITETHHRHKKDAPSGTAMVLAEAIATALDRPLGEHAIYGRQGHAPRQPGEIGIHALRAGGNNGEHVVLLADDGEEISIAHRAYSRRTFASGALRAARYLAPQPAGFYTMSDLTASSTLMTAP